MQSREAVPLIVPEERMLVSVPCAPVNVVPVANLRPEYVWVAVQILAWAILRDAITAPVVGVIVREESLFDTELTAPPPPPPHEVHAAPLHWLQVGDAEMVVS